MEVGASVTYTGKTFHAPLSGGTQHHKVISIMINAGSSGVVRGVSNHGENAIVELPLSNSMGLKVSVPTAELTETIPF